MPERVVSARDLKLGQLLPRDAFDGKGTLLLRRGQKITSPRQLERLVSLAPAPPATTSAPRPRRASPLQMLIDAQRQLRTLFTGTPGSGFEAKVLAIADSVQRACAANADVALASIVMYRQEPYAIRHAVNTAVVSVIVGRAAKLPAAQLPELVAAALTMNVAMLNLQQRLLAMHTPLTPDQRAAVDAHCERGVALLREHGVTQTLWLDIVRDHHERADGSGYPAHKTGAELDLATQIVSLADVYCARVSGRVHRPPMKPNVALRWLFLNEGMIADEHLAALFIKTLGIYPPGTGVRLHNGSIGVVTRRGSTNHSPQVASITTVDGLPISTPIRRRRGVPAYAVAAVIDLDALKLTASMRALWGADAAT